MTPGCVVTESLGIVKSILSQPFGWMDSDPAAGSKKAWYRKDAAAKGGMLGSVVNLTKISLRSDDVLSNAIPCESNHTCAWNLFPARLALIPAHSGTSIRAIVATG